MPTELVPKEKKPGVSLTFFRVIFHILLGLAFALSVSLVVVEVSKRRAKRRLMGLETRLSQEGLQKIGELEKEVFAFQTELSTYRDLLSSHKRGSLFFEFIGGLTHPEVSFDKLVLTVREDRAVLDGKTSSFKELREQILVLREEKEIKEVGLRKVSLGKEGGVKFTLELSLTPSVFKEK